MSAKVRGALLTLLGRRDYTAVELRERLIEKEFDATEVDEEISALTADGTISDRRVAASHIRVASELKGRGRMRIRQELMARGIAKSIAEALLKDIPSADETAAIRRFLDRKRFPADPTSKERQRVFQQLLRKGFPADAIGKALRWRPEED